MKPLLLILIVYSLQDLVRSHNGEKESLLLKSYPKKVHPNQMYNAKLINSPRILKTMPPEKPKRTMKPAPNNGYTVFPKVATQVPDSPYFPLEFDFLHKHRVKKMLPRRKRSAPNATNSALPAKVANKPVNKEAASKPKDTKQKGNTPKVSKPKANDPKVNKPKPAVAAKKAVLKKGNKTVSNTAKAGSPVSKSAQKSEARSGALPRPGKKSKTGKGGLPRKLGRHGGRSKKRHALRNANNVKNPNKPGQKGKLLKNKKQSKINQVNPKVAHKAPVPARRLVAARDAAAEDYPYMISIQKDGEHWCSGALLNRRLIISTANCFWKSTSISRLKVRAGSRHPDQGGQVAYIQEVMKHPSWSIRSGPDCDIALALLDRTLKFSHGVHGVDLPNRAMLPPFDDFWVTSFGAERRDGVYERHGQRLQVFHTRKMDRSKCSNITQRFGISVSANFICLTQYGRRSPCTRDTGAPAVSDGILWGLASWGIRKLCGTERYPAMFSYVASDANMDFIINATRHLMSDKRENPMLDRLSRQYNEKNSPSSTIIA